MPFSMMFIISSVRQAACYAFLGLFMMRVRLVLADFMCACSGGVSLSPAAGATLASRRLDASK